MVSAVAFKCDRRAHIGVFACPLASACWTDRAPSLQAPPPSSPQRWSTRERRPRGTTEVSSSPRKQRHRRWRLSQLRCASSLEWQRLAQLSHSRASGSVCCFRARWAWRPPHSSAARSTRGGRARRRIALESHRRVLQRCTGRPAGRAGRGRSASGERRGWEGGGCVSLTRVRRAECVCGEG